MIGLGHIADPDGHRVTAIRRLFERIGGGTSTPKSVDFRDAVVNGPLDQSITSSCVGHAIVGAIQTRFEYAGTPLPKLSPVSVYDWARTIDAPPEPRLFDTGCQPNQGFRGIRQWGIALWEDRPTDPAKINDWPKLGELESASGFQFDGEYGIDGERAAKVELLRVALARWVPVTVSLVADQALMNYSGGIYQPGGVSKGGHYVYLAGYDTLDNGDTFFHLVNSWGAAWGDNGFALMPESCVDGWNDCRGIDVKRVA